MQISELQLDAVSSSSASISDDQSSHSSGKPEPEQITMAPEVPTEIMKTLRISEIRSSDARIGKMTKITEDGNR